MGSPAEEELMRDVDVHGRVTDQGARTALSPSSTTTGDLQGRLLVAQQPRLQPGPVPPDSLRRLTLAGVDSSILVGSISVVSALGGRAPSVLGAALVFAAAWLTTGFFLDLYQVRVAGRAGPCAWAFIRTCAISLGVVLVLTQAAPGLHLYAGPVTLSVAIGSVLLWRAAYVYFGGSQDPQRSVLLLGEGPSVHALIALAEASKSPNIRLVGWATESSDRERHGVTGRDGVSPGTRTTRFEFPAGYRGLSDFARANGVEDLVLITSPDEESLPEIARCYDSGIRMTSMPQFYEELSGTVPVEYLDANWLRVFSLTPTGGPVYTLVKRIIDITISTVVLIVMSPILALSALAVRLSSPGPIFFRQLRVGLNGEHFYVIKFRTMTMEAGQWGARVGDVFDRVHITPLGRWLRRLYWDELPQLICVLAGQMSLVGPRPMRAEPALEMEEGVPLWRAKYSVRPGLTGLGQIGFGYAWDADGEIERLKYDLYYLRHRSLALDTVILLRTVLHVVKMGGQ